MKLYNKQHGVTQLATEGPGPPTAPALHPHLPWRTLQRRDTEGVVMPLLGMPPSQLQSAGCSVKSDRPTYSTFERFNTIRLQLNLIMYASCISQFLVISAPSSSRSQGACSALDGHRQLYARPGPSIRAASASTCAYSGAMTCGERNESERNGIVVL